MAIFGTIIKSLIDFSELLVADDKHQENQEKVLKTLLETAENTSFGKHYNFKLILDSEDLFSSFKSRIPFHDYDRMNEEWWLKIHEGQQDVTWPGSPDYFALSSGTTGKTSKRIPVTDQMIKAIRNGGIKQVLSLRNFDLPADFFEKEFMMLGSSTDLEEKDAHLEGEISGISASRIPFWFKGYYKPGDDIAKIDDWDDRVQVIAQRAKDWDIAGLSGIPSWMELMMQEVINYHGVNNIHEIWPNLQVYTSGGVAFGPYEKSFKKLLGKPVKIIDTYLASEGFIACQVRPETDAMQLITDGGIYFEFIPFKPEYIKEDGSVVENAPSLNLSQVEENQDYILIISTVSGAWRYLIGDTIEFINVDRAEIKITGRTKFFLNTVGSQLSVNKLDAAVKHLEQTFKTTIPEYTLCAKKIDNDFYHVWYLGSDQLSEHSETIAQQLDMFLQDANKNYKVARSKALKGVKVHLVKPEVFHEWNGKNKKKGGQVKMERVMGEDKFQEWENFTKL